MISITGIRSDRVTWAAALDGRVAVYLDTDSLQELAKRSAPRRRRFVEALRRRGSLWFSEASAVELGALQGRSAQAAQELLSSVGNCWVPLEMSPWIVAQREDAGLGLKAGISEWFVDTYAKQRLSDQSGAAIVSMCSETFFDLGEVVAWSQKERGDIRERQNRPW